MPTFSVFAAVPAGATEGGGSHFNPGVVGDFAMAKIGKPGFYLRSDLLYQAGDIEAVTLGRFRLEEAEARTWSNAYTLTYLAPWGVRGARFGAVLSVPLLLEAHLEGTLAEPRRSDQASRGGVGDLALTGFVNFRRDDFHASLGLGVDAPTGTYDESRLLNLGRNYWSFDPTFSFTWQDPAGFEVSLVTGLMFNTENPATDCRSGNEFHNHDHREALPLEAARDRARRLRLPTGHRRSGTPGWSGWRPWVGTSVASAARPWGWG